ncbi:TetR/AcrR family transcriptional regulator [Virgibacillus kekensis]|uniref:TetR/AcrR family transcriptional regulator n=1 Tax=Virgibacillus kekensis TaxID=202261 RepID=A0ABV9DHG6_9BACI
MNEKKLKLIEAGIKLFAEKGYHKTSIQEIATAAGVSKGAFYLYFQSKEDFIMTAFHYYHHEISQQIEAVKNDNHSPRESLAKQIEVVIRYIYEYKDFLTMQLRENFSVGENTDTFIHQMKMQNFHWLRENIIDIYGEKAEEHIIDLVIQLEGLMNGYFRWIVVDHVDMDAKELGEYLVRRMDDLVIGIFAQQETPLITEKNIPDDYQGNQDAAKKLIAMKGKINTLSLKKEKIDELHEVIDIILKEVNKKEPQRFMIQGMLVHFQRIPELEKECREIADSLQIDLLK